jgi:hypothetical protein
MYQIRMNLENPNSQLSKNIVSSSIQHRMAKTVSKNLSLNSSMIDRIHKAKPGCGSCGKKVV